MIDIIKQTPLEYSAQSRDYQVLARLYSALFNVSKMYIDNLCIWTNDIDNRLVTLRAKTLNFDIKHYWDENNLKVITDCFKYLMRRKGIKTTIEYCVNILMKIQGIIGETLTEPVAIDNYVITIRVPENMLTLGVIEDLLDHILPTGFIFNIVRYKSSNISDLNTEVVYEDGPITWEETLYTTKMYIGPSVTIKLSEERSEEWTPLSDKDKYWFGLLAGGYIPEDLKGDGLESVDLYVSDNDEYITINRDEPQKKVEISIPRVIKDEIDVKFITNTFIYSKNMVGDVEITEGDNYEQWERETD